jgi:hypothetical protein
MTTTEVHMGFVQSLIKDHEFIADCARFAEGRRRVGGVAGDAFSERPAARLARFC